MMGKSGQILESDFGTVTDPATGNISSVRCYLLNNKNNVTIRLISYGAAIVSIETPDKDGHVDDIVLGFDDIKGYQSSVNPYFGATVGRFANRIKDGQFKLDGKEYQLAKNLSNRTHLHGGHIGFDKVLWNSYKTEDSVIFTYLSPDGEEGYPGDLLVTAIYKLTDDNQLCITYRAMCTKPTPVNITNHVYFNLAGHGSGAEGLYRHDVMIKADHITAVDEDCVPNGELLPVEGTTYDLRRMVNLGEMIQRLQGEGYDNNFCLTKGDISAGVIEPGTGRYVKVDTTEPGIQFYTGNFLPKEKGKNGTYFEKQGAFCLESQKYPNSVNVNSFPCCILRPGEEYTHRIVYTFGTIS